MSDEPSSALTQKRKYGSCALKAIPDGPPPAKKIRRPHKIVDEDTYINGLSHIIARDFFPGLAATEAQQDFLDALASRDEAWIQEASVRVNSTLDHKSRQPRRGIVLAEAATSDSQRLGAISTPRGFAGDTPSVPIISQTSDAKIRPDTRLSLGAYQAQYTSEDNESFYALLDRQNQLNRDKHAYLFTGNQIPSSRQLEWRAREARLIEASQSSMDLALYKCDARPAMPPIKQSAPRNALMFLPDSIESTRETVVQAAEAASKAPPRAIAYKNTRLRNAQSKRANSEPASPSLTAIDDAVAGRPHLTVTEAGLGTPRVAGYAFVDATPTTEEQQAYQGGKRYNTIDPAITLARITKAATSVNSPFTVHEASQRERLHHKMIERISESHRESSSQLTTSSAFGSRISKSSTPKFKTAPRRDTGHLTPAARLLYSQFANKTQINKDQTPISDFDTTPRPARDKKATLMPGLAPKRTVEKRA